MVQNLVCTGAAVRSLRLAAAGLTLGFSAWAFAEPDALKPDAPKPEAPNTYSASAAYQSTYDDNLYRVPSNFADATTPVGLPANRHDRINTVSLGADGHWLPGNQV